MQADIVYLAIGLGSFVLFAGMLVLYLLFSKLFPIIAVWEFKPHPVEDE
jgi:hypothetical protein